MASWIRVSHLVVNIDVWIGINHIKMLKTTSNRVRLESLKPMLLTFCDFFDIMGYGIRAQVKILKVSHFFNWMFPVSCSLRNIFTKNTFVLFLQSLCQWTLVFFSTLFRVLFPLPNTAMIYIRRHCLMIITTWQFHCKETWLRKQAKWAKHWRRFFFFSEKSTSKAFPTTYHCKIVELLP